jgi:hypothetical protein
VWAGPSVGGTPSVTHYFLKNKENVKILTEDGWKGLAWPPLSKQVEHRTCLALKNLVNWFQAGIHGKSFGPGWATCLGYIAQPRQASQQASQPAGAGVSPIIGWNINIRMTSVYGASSPLHRTFFPLWRFLVSKLFFCRAGPPAGAVAKAVFTDDFGGRTEREVQLVF